MYILTHSKKEYLDATPPDKEAPYVGCEIKLEIDRGSAKSIVKGNGNWKIIPGYYYANRGTLMMNCYCQLIDDTGEVRYCQSAEEALEALQFKNFEEFDNKI